MTDPTITVATGERVANLLADEAVRDAFEAVKAKYRHDLENGKTTDERELAWHRLHVFKDVIAQLKVVVGNGHVAQASIQAQSRKAPIIP